MCSWWKSFHFSACWIFMKTSWRPCWNYRLMQMSRQFWRSTTVSDGREIPVDLCKKGWRGHSVPIQNQVSTRHLSYLTQFPSSATNRCFQSASLVLFWMKQSSLGKLNCTQITSYVFKLFLICKEIFALTLFQFKVMPKCIGLFQSARSPWSNWCK